MKMKQRWLYTFLPFLVVALIWWGLASLAAVQAYSAECPVPSVPHPTIQSAVADTNCHTIQLTDPLYIENVTITRSLSIYGSGMYSTTVDGAASGTVFKIEPGLMVTITDMSVTNGSNTNGGGIHNMFSYLKLWQVQVFSNAGSYAGGGIFNDYNSILEIANSAIHHNTAVIGGGVYNGGLVDISNSQMTITGSVIYSNAATSGSGGGLYNNLEAQTDIANSTISFNRAGSAGGGLENLGFISMMNLTINGNDSPFGGGLFNSGQITVGNTIIANSPNGSNCVLSGSLNSIGHNLDSDDSCGLTAVGDITNTNPLLGQLQDNGGPTLTHALLANSPAQDAGDDIICQSALVNGIDQRGVSRPQGPACDIGAFEKMVVVDLPYKNYLPIVRRQE